MAELVPCDCDGATWQKKRMLAGLDYSRRVLPRAAVKRPPINELTTALAVAVSGRPAARILYKHRGRRVCTARREGSVPRDRIQSSRPVLGVRVVPPPRPCAPEFQLLVHPARVLQRHPVSSRRKR